MMSDLEARPARDRLISLPSLEPEEVGEAAKG
jgi:hypothetical protein